MIKYISQKHIIEYLLLEFVVLFIKLCEEYIYHKIIYNFFLFQGGGRSRISRIPRNCGCGSVL